MRAAHSDSHDSSGPLAMAIQVVYATIDGYGLRWCLEDADMGGRVIQPEKLQDIAGKK